MDTVLNIITANISAFKFIVILILSWALVGESCAGEGMNV